MIRWDTRTRPLRANRTFLLFMAVSAGLLCGCGDTQYESKKMQLLSGATETRIPSGSDLVYGSDAAPRSTAQALGNVGGIGKSESERDRIAKGDLYFKLEWASQVLDRHVVPSELRSVVDKGLVAMRAIASDRASAALVEALELYDRAIEIHMQTPEPEEDEFPASAGADKKLIAAAYHPDEKTGERVRIHLKSPTVTTKPGEDAWSLFRSARPKIEEAGRALGLLDKGSTPYAQTPFSGNPLDADPFKQ